MKIAVLGTGLMGAPMARNLAAAGHELTLWNRSAAKAAALAEIGRPCASPTEAAQGADVVLSMLLDGPAAQEVLRDQGAMAASAPGALILNMGSVDPGTDRALAHLAEEQGRDYLDAPVSGGVAGAEAATLAILVGGRAEAFDRAAPLFAALGRATHLGPTGAGQVAKLANQLIVASTIGAVAEAFALAKSAGCDPAALRSALMGGFADSRILDLHGARMVSGDYTPGGRSIAQVKDLDNALAVAAETGLDLPVAQRVTEGFRDLVETHDGAELDHSAYYLWLSLRQA